jgi:hypothetical protein
MTLNNETKLFNDNSGNELSLNDLFSTIYDNSKSKGKEITLLISTITPFLQTQDDVIKLLPLIKQLFDVGIQNDDQLVKMTSIVQRYITSREKMESESNPIGGAGIINEDERKMLIELASTEYKLLEEDNSIISNQIMDYVNTKVNNVDINDFKEEVIEI